MTRKSNIGVSIVEILIALTVFMILLIPIVSSLITGMKTTTSAKETQYRNDYVRNLMEHVKEVPISVLKDAADTKDYFESLGAKGVTITQTNQIETSNYDKYVIKGTTNIGTENTQYSYWIEISGEDYAIAEGSGYLNPNSLTSGVVEDFDQTKVALISAPFANYDYPAYDALLTQKMAKLQEQEGEDFDPVEDVKTFNDHTCRRTITVKVSWDVAKAKYIVQCLLKYENMHNGNTTGEEVTYTPYIQEFAPLSNGKAPNIYLMYNACVYNGMYAQDVITFDVDGTVEDDVNVFVIGTAADYASDDYKAMASGEGVTLHENDNDILYRTVDGENRADQVVTFNDVTGHVHVYHNLDEVNLKVRCNVHDIIDADSDCNHNIGSLNEVQNNRGLYKVKIWMQEGDVDDVDAENLDPILQGTRGGDEIE